MVSVLPQSPQSRDEHLPHPLTIWLWVARTCLYLPPSLPRESEGCLTSEVALGEWGMSSLREGAAAGNVA